MVSKPSAMPQNTQTQDSDPSKIASSLKPLDEAALSDLLRQSLFPEDEEQQTQAETEDDSETEDDLPEGEVDSEEEDQETTSEETDSEDNAEEADDEEEEDVKEEDTSSKMPRGIQKRIDKLVAQKKALEAKLQQLSEQDQSKSTDENQEKLIVPVGKNLNPYFSLQTEGEVYAEIEKAWAVRDWAEDHPDGAVVLNKDGEEVEYSAEEVRKAKKNAIHALEKHLPKQLNYIAVRKQFDSEAEKAYPFLKDRSNPDYQYVNALVKEFPEIVRFPDYKLSLGDMVEGKKLRESKMKAKGKQSIKVAPKTPRSNAAPVESTSSSAKIKNAESIFRKNPTENTLKDLIAERFL